MATYGQYSVKILIQNRPLVKINCPQATCVRVSGELQVETDTLRLSGGD